MADVLKFYPKDAADNPDLVLEQAVGQYNEVLILGWDKDNFLDPRANTSLKRADLLYLVEIFKRNLLEGMYDPDDA